MIACMRRTAHACLAGDSETVQRDGTEILAIVEALEAGGVFEKQHPGRPVVPWLPDHPLYVCIAEFDGFARGPRFSCDRYGIPIKSERWGGPMIWETRLDLAGTRESAEERQRMIAGRHGNTAIARLEIVEATIGDGP
jgi:hypothetical protein